MQSKVLYARKVWGTLMLSKTRYISFKIPPTPWLYCRVRTWPRSFKFQSTKAVAVARWGVYENFHHHHPFGQFLFEPRNIRANFTARPIPILKLFPKKNTWKGTTNFVSSISWPKINMVGAEPESKRADE